MRDRQIICSLKSRLLGLRGKRVGLLTHIGGDADALASCFVTSNILSSKFDVDVAGIFIPDQVSENTYNMAKRIGVAVSSELVESEVYIALDVGSREQLGSFLDKVEGRLIVVDHHEPSPSRYMKAEVFASPTYQSTSEIILELSQAVGYELNTSEATALFAGIYYDTVRLTVADDETLKKIGKLGSAGASPASLLPYLDMPMDYSERIARLKAAKRLTIYKCGEIVVASSKVGAYRPSAARALIGLGANVAIVGYEDNGIVDISLRQTNDTQRVYGLNLVRDVVGPLTSKLGGSGGGHAVAARLTIPGSLEDVIARCVSQIAYLMGSTPVKVED